MNEEEARYGEALRQNKKKYKMKTNISLSDPLKSLYSESELEFHEELTLKAIADFVKRVAELEAQNAELLDALQAMVWTFEKLGNGRAIVQARAVISKQLSAGCNLIS